LKKEYVRRVRLILNIELSTKNNMQAVGTLAIPVLRYNSRSINCHQEEIQILGRKRKMLTNHGQHHPRAGNDCLYVPRKEGVRAPMHTKGAYITEVMKLMEYTGSKEDPLIQIVRTHQHHTNSTLLQAVNNVKKSFKVKKKKRK
jgi:hypothetical protein